MPHQIKQKKSLEKQWKTTNILLRFPWGVTSSCEMPDWMNHKLESRLPAEICTISDMQMLFEWQKGLTKEPLMRVKEETEKSWLKTQHSKKEDLGIRSHHFMADRWGESGNSGRFYFLGLQNYCGW